MKNIIKFILSLFLVVSFNSCEDSNNTIDEVSQFENGAVLRTLAVLSSTLNSSDPSSFWGVEIEEQDVEDGALLKSVGVYVSIRDLTPDNGTTSVSDMLIKTLDASAFDTNTPFGLPRITIIVTFAEAEAAMGLSSADHAPGDIFVFELKLELTDGRIFDASSAASIITGGFFSSPFAYNALILCSPQSGDYTVDMHDSYGDGWQTDGGSGGSGITIDLGDGTILEVGMCSPYGGASGSFLEDGAGTGCTPNDGYNATATVTIPVGAEQAVWFFPGDAYGEISFEIYGPGGEELFVGAQGATGPGILPITLCGN